ncbi:MAG: arsenate reductase (glutaredoxin) [Acidimicrobiales bacterium]
MADVTVYHNPNCSSSKTALAMAADAGIDVDVVQYLKTKPDADELRGIVAKLDGPVTEMVRRDANFAKLGLTDADVETADQVVALLAEHPALLQRPIVVRGDRAVVGRPKERIAALLGTDGDGTARSGSW